MEFSHHAKNEMRLYKIAPADVARVVAKPKSVGEDRRGNPRLTGVARGVLITVVIARDQPGFVITLWEVT